MAIYAENTGTTREPIEAGNHLGRCYQMLHIGTVLETIPGQQPKKMNKVRLGFELPEELRGDGKPETIAKEYTLSMHEKSSLRKMLEGWRGKKFTDEEAKRFDITALLGMPCLINVIINEKGYNDIVAVTKTMKNQVVPGQFYATQELNYDQFNESLFDSLPNFIKDKIKKSEEYAKWIANTQFAVSQEPVPTDDDLDLPF